MKIEHSKSFSIFALSFLPILIYNKAVEIMNNNIEIGNLVNRLAEVSSIKYAKNFHKKAKKLSYQQTGNNTDFVVLKLRSEIRKKIINV